MIGDVLQGFGIFFQGAKEAGGCFEEGFRGAEGGEFLEGGGELGFAGAVVGGAEEEDGVGAGVDGVEVGDFGGCAAHGVGECLCFVILCAERVEIRMMGFFE